MILVLLVRVYYSVYIKLLKHNLSSINYNLSISMLISFQVDALQDENNELVNSLGSFLLITSISCTISRWRLLGTRFILCKFIVQTFNCVNKGFIYESVVCPFKIKQLKREEKNKGSFISLY